eukprot:sb/3476680/
MGSDPGLVASSGERDFSTKSGSDCTLIGYNFNNTPFSDNPLSKTAGYRHKVLCMFTQACRRADIVVDGKGFSDKEKKKAKSTRVKGSTPHGPFTMPPFGSTSSQLPTTLDQPGLN